MDTFDPGEISVVSPDAAARENRFVNAVFMWMTGGLAATGVTAYYTAAVFGEFILRNQGLFMLLIILEVLMVMGLSFAVNRISALAAAVCFSAYAVMNGITLSWIFLAYDPQSIYRTFFISSGVFGATGLYGYLTKRDLTTLGSLCMMGLFGVIIASIINLFWFNSMASLVISILGVLIFVGLIAYDTQMLKRLAGAVGAGEVDGETGKKYSIIGALQLYLDFVNLFLYLLRLFGSRK